MKRGFLIITFMFMFNASTVLVSSLPIWGGVSPTTPYNVSNVDQSLNPWGVIDSWKPPETGGLFGDVKQGLEALRYIQAFIEAFPATVRSISYMPMVWAEFLIMCWNMIWWLSVLDLIMGGKILGG